MEEIISSTNLSFIKEAINYVSEELDFNNYKEALWLIYGSYVINMNTSGSDLDVIAIHNTFTENKRSVYKFKGVPIHLTSINMKSLADDGENRFYGSYFSGKIINPHIFLYGDEKLKKESLYHAGKFIGALAGFLSEQTNSKLFTASQVTAFVFIAYLSTDPSFDSYFLNYFVSPNFDNIWNGLCKTTTNTLITSKSITQRNGKYAFKAKFNDYKTFHIERMKISARHWSYGAVCHGANHEFPDIIYSKAEKKMDKIDPTGEKYSNMITFLKEQSGLSKIYI